MRYLGWLAASSPVFALLEHLRPARVGCAGDEQPPRELPRPLVLPSWRRRRAAGAPAALLALALAGCGDEGPAAPRASAFVDEAACAECHADEAAGWSGSQHDRAMQVADETSVLGDFDECVHDELGLRTRFHRDGARFLIETEGPDGARGDFEVRYTFGVHPLQQYLVELGDGRLQAYTVAWDVERERWFRLYPEQRFEPGDTLHWTGRYQRWNLMCAECHSTGLEKNYEPATDGYATTWQRVDVGCQACHGPGGEHVRLARAGAGTGAHDRRWAEDRGLDALLRRGEQAAQLDACAPCHSRRLLLDEAPTGRFLDRCRPRLLEPGLYFPDGQILDEVYVYGSFAQSKMHMRGVTCTDCHDPHGLGRWQEGDALCQQCHSTAPPLERFPTLQAKDYATREHHGHDPDGAGARCVACHMPERTYMVIDPRRDHSFRIPRPDLSVQLGLPNACAACHADEGAQWAAERLAERHGAPNEEPPSFAPVFALAGAMDPPPIQLLAAVAGDPERPAIVRATALHMLGELGAQGGQAVVAALGDGDALVRATAAEALSALPVQVRAALAGSLLSDDVRAVRIAAARALAGAPDASLSPEQRVALKSALEEYRAVQLRSADAPFAQLNLAVLDEELGHLDSAGARYLRALELDPWFAPARLNYARLRSGQGRGAEAVPVLRAGVERTPDEGEVHYSLGLLLAELGRVDEAVEPLARAAELLPGRARVQYNLGLALQHAERRAEAERALLRAAELDPRAPDFVYALAVFYRQGADELTALRYARRLVDLVPDDPGARRLYEELEQPDGPARGPRRAGGEDG